MVRSEELDAIRETANRLQRIKEKQDSIKDLMRDFTIKTREEAWLELVNELEARGILTWFKRTYSDITNK